MATVHGLYDAYNGEVVPKAFNAGFVALSYVVSLIGAISTLELINRRTSPKGVYNHLLLASAAVTMGGISIWCMHYIGNRAIDLAGGQGELQIAYSPGFTALSFFIPIIVLACAFWAVGGTEGVVSWVRVICGGVLTGSAVCGMHYLGNASIENYTCVYNIGNVIGAAIIAVIASTVALALFFVFRAAWNSSWWKRAICAVVLAGAVSGMHWCASTGTNYRLLHLNNGNQLSRNTTVIVVICLSVGACLVVGGLVVYTARVARRYADKAQQVVLASAVFDPRGRILVSPDGLLPSEKITDAFLENSANDQFGISHPLFQWMFQASRDWASIQNLIAGMANHLAHLPRGNARDLRSGIQLITEHGELIENYDVIFRELFCVAAAALADKMKSPLEQVGILWDDIIPTGAGPVRRPHSRRAEPEDTMSKDELAKGAAGESTRNVDDLAEKGINDYTSAHVYRGSLMFLVRSADTAEVERLQAAGYRFAELYQVSGIIGSTMQIKTPQFESKLRNMAVYAHDNTMLEPGVHLGFFGVRARVGHYGFDVLARKGARNLLPSVQLPVDRLDARHMDLMARLDRLTPAAILRRLDDVRRNNSSNDNDKSDNKGNKEAVFASQLADAIGSLRSWIDDAIFDEAILTARAVEVPCRAYEEGEQNTCTMMAFRTVIPIHASPANARCELVPLSFFKVCQLAYKDAPHHAVFARSVHRDMAPIINSVPMLEKGPRIPAAVAAAAAGGSQYLHPHGGPSGRRGSSFRLRTSGAGSSSRRRSGTSSTTVPVDADGNPIPTVLGGGADDWPLEDAATSASGQSSSTLKLWPGSGAASNAGGEKAPGSGPGAGGRRRSSEGILPPSEAESDASLQSSPRKVGGQQLQRQDSRNGRQHRHSRSHSSNRKDPGGAQGAGAAGTSPLSALGGIMVSQEITVESHPAAQVRFLHSKVSTVQSGGSKDGSAAPSQPSKAPTADHRRIPSLLTRKGSQGKQGGVPANLTTSQQQQQQQHDGPEPDRAANTSPANASSVGSGSDPNATVGQLQASLQRLQDRQNAVVVAQHQQQPGPTTPAAALPGLPRGAGDMFAPVELQPLSPSTASDARAAAAHAVASVRHVAGGHMGLGGISAVEVEKTGRDTFVDELFAVCVEGR